MIDFWFPSDRIALSFSAIANLAALAVSALANLAALVLLILANLAASANLPASSFLAIANIPETNKQTNIQMNERFYTLFSQNKKKKKGMKKVTYVRERRQRRHSVLVGGQY